MVGFPLLLIPLAVYNIIVWLMPGVALDAVLFKVPMVTGEAWPVTLSDALLALGIVLLLLEVVKGARPGAKYLTDHLLSLIVFGAAAAEFVMWPKFGNSTFFLLTLLAMADFLGGVAQRTRRRGYGAAAAPVFRKASRQVEEPVIEPVPEPAPRPASPPQPAPVVAPPSPSAQSVAESVLLDHPVPRPLPGATAASPDNLSPEPSAPAPAEPEPPSR